jgi:cytochrome c-type biogenesis protein CcmH/NrfF
VIRRALIVMAALVALVAPAAALGAEPRASVTEIEGEVMCPVCGTLLELAESPQALREKAFVKRLAEEGETKAQIKDALVAEYGEAVLALPRGSGFDLSAYVVPILAFLVAVIALVLGVLRWRRAGGGGGGDDGPRPPGPSREESERLDADLARYDL